MTNLNNAEFMQFLFQLRGITLENGVAACICCMDNSAQKKFAFIYGETFGVVNEEVLCYESLIIDKFREKFPSLSFEDAKQFLRIFMFGSVPVVTSLDGKKQFICSH